MLLIKVAADTHPICVLWAASADAVVLQRLLELLGIVCTRLQRTYGLVHEEYRPAAGHAPWTPASDSTINYGAATLLISLSSMLCTLCIVCNAPAKP